MILVVLVMALVGGAVPSAAADDQAASLERLAPGDELRVLLHDGHVVEGRLSTVSSGRLVVDEGSGPAVLDPVDMKGVWRRGRNTRGGAKTGAWIVGVAGGAYGALAGAYLESLEGDSGTPVAGIVLGSVLGAGLGAAAGGLTGGLVGAALPSWETIWTDGTVDESMPAQVDAGSSRRGTGILDLAAGRVDSGIDAGAAYQAALLAPVGRGLRIGLETFLTGTVEPKKDYEPLPYDDIRSATNIQALLIRAEQTVVSTESGFAVSVVTGAGPYSWVDAYLGVNAGIGVRWLDPDGRFGWTADLRRHVNLQHLTETNPDATILFVGATRTW